MKNIEEKEKKKKSVFKIIFLISLLYYVFWLLMSLHFCFNGIDSGWIIPAMSSGKLMYGLDAFMSGIIIGLLYTLEIFWIIPLYQISYIIGIIINYIYKKIKTKRQ